MCMRRERERKRERERDEKERERERERGETKRGKTQRKVKKNIISREERERASFIIIVNITALSC